MTKPNYYSYQTERPVGLTWLLELKLELGDVSSETKLPPSGQAINLPYFPPAKLHTSPVNVNTLPRNSTCSIRRLLQFSKGKDFQQILRITSNKLGPKKKVQPILGLYLKLLILPVCGWDPPQATSEDHSFGDLCFNTHTMCSIFARMNIAVPIVQTSLVLLNVRSNIKNTCLHAAPRWCSG